MKFSRVTERDTLDPRRPLEAKPTLVPRRLDECLRTNLGVQVRLRIWVQVRGMDQVWVPLVQRQSEECE